MSEKNLNNIPASAFEFVPMEGRMHDKKLDTKPMSYFRDAFSRFCRNKSSVIAACIILVLLFGVLVCAAFLVFPLELAQLADELRGVSGTVPTVFQ